MPKNTIIAVIISIGLSTYLCACHHEYVIPFHIITTDESMLTLTNLYEIQEPDEYALKGIPQLTTTYKLYTTPVNNSQHIYNKYVNKEITKEQYSMYVSKGIIDTAQITTLLEKKNNLNCYVGVNMQQQKKYFMVDANFNQDFSDDSLYIFSFDECKEQRNVDEVKTTRISIYPYHYDGSKCIQVENSICVLPCMGVVDLNKFNINNYLNIEIGLNAHAIGNTKIEKYDFEIHEVKNTCDFIPKNIDNQSSFRFRTEKIDIPFSYTVGDTVSLIGRHFLLKKVEKNRLFLKDLGRIYLETNQFPKLYACSINDNQIILINDYMNGKYTLVDFWGSWCGACIRSLPSIKEIYEKVRENDNAMIIGVALEFDKIPTKLRNIINRNQIEWLNVWINWEESKEFMSKNSALKIEGFPTLVIVNEEGKIVARSDQMDTRDPIEARKRIMQMYLQMIQN